MAVPEIPSLQDFGIDDGWEWHNINATSIEQRNIKSAIVGSLQIQFRALSEGKKHFNGAVPIKRARLDLTTTTTPDAAQIRRRREAKKAYGRGRKIPLKGKDKKLRGNLKALEAKYKTATLRAKDAKNTHTPATMPLLRLIATSDPDRMITCLEHIVQTAPPNCDIRLQTTPVAFEDGKTRKNTTAWNYTTLKTFSEWDSTRLDGAAHKAGLFITRVETSVGKLPEHRFPDWHAWGAILKNDGFGKTLIIWDPDGPRNWIPDEDLRYGSLMGMQHNLIKYCKRKYRLNAVWLSGGDNPEGLCISLSRDWLESVIQGGIPSLEEFRLVKP